LTGRIRSLGDAADMAITIRDAALDDAPAIAVIYGRWVDTIIMEKLLADPQSP
jgi:hypothetical protein